MYLTEESVMHYREHSGVYLIARPPSLKARFVADFSAALQRPYIRYLGCLVAVLVSIELIYTAASRHSALVWILGGLNLVVASWLVACVTPRVVWLFLLLFAGAYLLGVRRKEEVQQLRSAPSPTRIHYDELDRRAYIPFGSVVTYPDGRTFMVLVSGAQIKAASYMPVMVRCLRADGSQPPGDDMTCLDCRDAR